MRFTEVDYKELTAKAQETYNYQKLAGRLADFGIECVRLHNDDNGPDFLAYSNDVGTLAVQLKGRAVIDRKYQGKGLFIAFPTWNPHEEWVIYPHDEFLHWLFERNSRCTITESWKIHGSYAWRPPAPKWVWDWFIENDCVV